MERSLHHDRQHSALAQVRLHALQVGGGGEEVAEDVEHLIEEAARLTRPARAPKLDPLPQQRHHVLTHARHLLEEVGVGWVGMEQVVHNVDAVCCNH
eukprot:751812-Hanusia_phi.AAC.2